MEQWPRSPRPRPGALAPLFPQRVRKDGCFPCSEALPLAHVHHETSPGRPRSAARPARPATDDGGDVGEGCKHPLLPSRSPRLSPPWAPGSPSPGCGVTGPVWSAFPASLQTCPVGADTPLETPALNRQGASWPLAEGRRCAGVRAAGRERNTCGCAASEDGEWTVRQREAMM